MNLQKMIQRAILVRIP